MFVSLASNTHKGRGNPAHQEGSRGMTQTLAGDKYKFIIDVEAAAESEPDRVAPGFACPQCGENRMDYLVSDDGVVRCATCGTCYEL